MLSQQDIEELKEAKRLLESNTLAGKMQSVLGKPIEEGMKHLPAKWTDALQQTTEHALRKALEFAVKSLGTGVPPSRASNALHKALVTASGAAGGAFGLPALAVELPVSTTMMLRSIADIARCEGEDIHRIEGKLACLEVFALGGSRPGDDRAQTGYFAVRAMLTRQFREAAQVLAGRGLAGETAPAVVRMIGAIASRFGVTVSEKAAASAVPVIGAVGGGLINMIFMDHFQDMARGHFIVRRLERVHGKEAVEEVYQSLPI